MRPTIELTISENTARFIDILRKYQHLYTDVLDALQMVYGEREGLEVFNEQFLKEYDALEAQLKEMVMTSIADNLLPINPTEI